MRPAPILFAAAALALPTSALAQFGDPNAGYGVRAGASTIESCPSFCTGDLQSDSDGGELILSASAAEATHGTARGSGFYDGAATYLPVLKAFASANAGAGASGSAFGAQRYTYDGVGTKNIVIDFDLDAVIAQGTGNPDSRALAEVVAYRNGGEFITDFGTLRFEAGIDELAFDSTFLSATGAAIGQLSFEVEPGDVFWVAAGLSASAERGGTANAENTFTATFADATGLTASGVPEPASAALLALGGLALLRRRQAA